jgi:hypothetical protein
LRLIENLRKDHDKSSKAVENLRANNADLAKTLSSKEQKIQDLEKVLSDRDEDSVKEVSEINNKLKLLFKEYEKALMKFGVCPTPFPADIGISDFMEWIDTEFKALSGVISGAKDFATAFSVESILKLLCDFNCADLVKFREKLSQFSDASSTSRIQLNTDVLAINAKFASWFSSWKEVVKNIARTKLEHVIFSKTLLIFANSRTFCLSAFLDSFLCSFQLIEEERRGKGIEIPESSSEDEDDEGTENAGEDSGENGSDGSSSSSSSDVEGSPDHEESSPKVDIIG